jgi:WD40 repeat protein
VFPLRDGRFFTSGQEAYHDNVWWARIWTSQGDSTPLIEASDLPLKGFELADGRLLLGTNSHTPTIWHTDGTRGPVLRGHAKPAYGAAQWPDGRIATRGADHTARIWNRDGTPLLVLLGHEGGVSWVEPLSGERFLTWSFRDRTARVWGEEPRPRNLLRLEGGDAENVQQLSNGSIAVHNNTGSIELYSADLEPGPSLRNEARAVIGLIEMPDGRLLTQGSYHTERQPGPALRVWSAAGEVVADLAGLDAEFLHVAHTPSGRILGFDRLGQVWVWRADGRLEGKHRGAETSQFYRIFSLRSGRFVTSGDDNQLQVWSAEGEPGEVLDNNKREPAREIVSFGDGRMLMISWNEPPRIREASGNRGPSLEFGSTLRVMDVIPLQDGRILLKRPDGSPVFVSSDGSFHEMRLPPGPNEGFPRNEFFGLADGRLLVSTPDQGTRIWNADGMPGKQILDSPISGAKLLSDGSFLVWSADQNDLRIIDPEGQPGPVLRGHESAIREAFQLSDGRILSWAEDASVRIWLGSIDQAITWADEVISRLRPLTLTERCQHYLEPPMACAGVEDP